MLPFVRALLAAACLLPLAFPASASAALSIGHVQGTGVELQGNDDDVVTPGDRISVDEVISTSTGFTNATGTLMSPTPGVTVEAPTAAYPNTGSGGQAQNATPFEANLEGSIPCGSLLQFT